MRTLLTSLALFLAIGCSHDATSQAPVQWSAVPQSCLTSATYGNTAALAWGHAPSTPRLQVVGYLVDRQKDEGAWAPIGSVGAEVTQLQEQEQQRGLGW
jgi:hypothetical protein